MIVGVDCSHHQGTVLWKKVAAAGYRFVFLKATQGASFTDHMFLANVRGAKAAGLLVGAYHYFTPTGDAGAQFSNFWCQILNAGGPSGMLLPVLDVEGNNDNELGWMSPFAYTKSCLAWLQYLEQKIGKKGMVYTYPYFAGVLSGRQGLMSYPLGKYPLSQYPLWAASYRAAGKPVSFGGWGKRFAFHQFTDSGQVSGINGRVDLDVFNGTEADLKKYII